MGLTMMNFALALWSLTAAAASANHVETVLRPEGIETLFIEPDRPTTIHWRADNDLPTEPLRYTIRDFQDREVLASVAERGTARTVVLELTLAQGYYEIEFARLPTRFGIVALPSDLETPDAFFCIDSALSWLVRDAGLREGLVRVLRRSGIAMSRERLNWSELQGVRERFDWNARSGYETVRQLHAAQQVPVLEMFHSATPWSGLVGKYPEDLVGTADSWQKITRRWRATWGGLEIWNEPDIFFGDHLPADQYVALVKTVAYAAATEAPELTLVGGVTAHYHGPFLDTAAECGMLECVDVASFHTYDRAAQMQALVARYRSWLAKHGHPGMPLWITESGRPWKKGPDRPPVDQDLASALDITRKAIEVRACGVARYFAFVYPFYEENDNNFGMLDRQGTPLRSFAAYVQAARVLGGKSYRGDIQLDASLPTARVFGDDRELVAVLTAPPDTARSAVAIDLPVLRAEALDGRRIELTAANEVPLVDGLAYVWLDPAAATGRLATQTETMRLWTLGQAAPPRRRASSPIVLRWQNDPGSFQPETAGYRLVSETPGQTSLKVRAFNLSDQPTELRLTLQPADAAAQVRGENPRTLHIPAAGFADAAWDVDLASAFARDERLSVTVRPVADAPLETLPLAVTLIGSPTLAQRRDRYPRQLRLLLSQSDRWQPNIPSYGRLELQPQADDSVVLKVRFGEGDRWVYPYFQLPDDMDLSRFSSLVLRARCERPATVRVFLWEADSGVGYHTATGVVPADDKWHAAEVRFDELTLCHATAPDANGQLDVNQVRRLSFGMNSEAAENRLEISEAYLVGPE